MSRAVALHSAGRGEEAMRVVKENLVRHPGDRDTLLALVSFSRDAGDVAAALGYAEQLARVAPGEPGLAGLIENLRRVSRLLPSASSLPSTLPNFLVSCIARTSLILA